MNKPNILLLMTDQQRWDAMSCSGDWVRTPHMDSIAAEGVRFTNCVANSPVCIPTRLSLATGLYPHNTGVWNNGHHQMAADQPTWMQAVRAAGYRTSLFGKTHLHPHSGDLRDREDLMASYGLDDVDEIGGPRASARVLSHLTARWEKKGKWEAYRADFSERFANRPQVVRASTVGLEDYADTYVGECGQHYLQSYDRPEPWFCWISFGGPHEPWDAPEPYASMYSPESMPPAVAAPTTAPRGTRPTGGLDDRLGNRPPLSATEIAQMRANYAGNVTLIDDAIGRILTTVKERGEWENTVVVFASDHGEMNGDHGLIYKSNFLNPAVRVPLLVRVPGATSGMGAVSRSPVEWMDIGPTLVDLAGGEIDYEQFGRSLVPVVEDPDATHRREAISELDGEIMLLDQEWKIALNRDGQAYLLFDVKEDPSEVDNLAGRPHMRQVETELRLRILERLIGSQLQGKGRR
jgi:choline-sulfatase